MASAGILGEVNKTVEATSTEIARPLSGWIPSLEAAALVRGTLILNSSSGNFGVRLGIEISVDGVTTSKMALAADTAYVSSTGTAGKKFYNFDPTGATNGNVATAPFFRIIALCKSTDANPSQGNFTLVGGQWR